MIECLFAMHVNENIDRDHLVTFAPIVLLGNCILYEKEDIHTNTVTEPQLLVEKLFFIDYSWYYNLCLNRYVRNHVGNSCSNTVL